MVGQAPTEQKDNMAKKPTEAIKVYTRQQSYLVIDEEKDTKELLENMLSKFNINKDEGK